MATMWNSINESGYVGATETFSSIFCQFVGIWDCMQKINTLFSVKRSKIFSGKMLSWIHTFTPKVHHEESETYASSPSKELRENNSAKQFCCIFLYCVGSSKHNKSSQWALNIVFPPSCLIPNHYVLFYDLFWANSISPPCEQLGICWVIN